ncbi:ATP SYNTHASE DELTA CHAIN [Salix viminalis]|uniref:ATP SYNTHASE DELTA CHAIN n=1 Tax=Salix viminalis TaxID=40686 RepID=A0A9Q0SFI5_SALVM|nr:ATP SYNTHASE DELTA CHAIN [Salix viminalis]
MDTISTPISTLKVPAFFSTPLELQHFRTPHVSHQLPPNLSTKPNSSISNRTPSKAKTLPFKNPNSPLISNISHISSNNSSLHTHRSPASGYAAALVDIARCKSSLDIVQNDVQKLLKLLQNEQIQAVLGSPFVGEKEKGQVVQEVAKRGKFNRYLLGLVKMLIERNKVMIVSDVLMEFERIYDELSGTKVVLVSSPTKMKEDQLFWIAKTVQNRSGAVSVKVKNFFDEKLPAPAV